MEPAGSQAKFLKVRLRRRLDTWKNVAQIYNESMFVQYASTCEIVAYG
jgi:hypothetical protein